MPQRNLLIILLWNVPSSNAADPSAFTPSSLLASLSAELKCVHAAPNAVPSINSQVTDEREHVISRPREKRKKPPKEGGGANPEVRPKSVTAHF